MRIIPNQSEKRFVSRLVKNGKKSIRPNPMQQSELIRTNPKPSFQSRSIRVQFGLVRIHSDSYLGLNRIMSDRFSTIFHQTSYKTFFGLARNNSHWLGYRYRN